LQIAQKANDAEMEARAYTELGTLMLVQGTFQGARDLLQKALPLHQQSGDVAWQGRTLLSLGNVFLMRGDIEKTRACFERALPRFQAVGEVVLEGACRGSLGTVEQVVGNQEAALKHFERAIGIHRDVGAPRFEGCILIGLGSLCHETGRLQQAKEHYRRGHRILRDVGDVRWEGITLGYTATLLHEEGQLQQAWGLFDKAVELLNSSDPRVVSVFLGGQAAVEAAMGRPDEARARLARAETMAKATSDPLLAPSLKMYAAFVSLADASAEEDEAARHAHLERARRQLRVAREQTQSNSAAALRSDLADLFRLGVRILGLSLSKKV
jgi:tetratricopeptide (TPR) repeat protein